MRVLLALLVVIVCHAGAEEGHAADKVGVVLMHGKAGSSLPKSPIGQLTASLQRAGFLVTAPNMPWARNRYLAKDYEASMEEIDAAVARLKERGATKIVVGGHSMGGNAALGYGARRDGIAGIMVLAPGHTPSRQGYQSSLALDYKRAQKMVDEGKGKAFAKFRDNDQGKKRQKRFRAGIYLSWFGKEGPASMPENARNLRPGTALLWVVGKKDHRMYQAGESFAFSHAPAHPKSRYLEVGGGHRQTPVIATKQIIKWLRGI
ncbi:MAG: alpha/beta fold hydrolase [Alphaproteobacteria bacterium]|nr:MAG: alpha/beta fold hydrolase [Alphaproteobacteria bacterium]